MKIEIETVHNGYINKVEGSIKQNGVFIAKNTEELQMLEFIGEILLGKKIRVEYR